MAESITLARPYARAAFNQAESKRGGLKRWSTMLQALAAVASDEAMARLLASPRLGPGEKSNLLCEIASEIPEVSVTKECQNFIRLLADNRRLALLPEVVAVYEGLRAAAEQTVHATVVSACPLSDEQREKIAAGLKRRLKREVELDISVDESLICGAVIRAGDLVIDGTARAQLARLGHTLHQ